MIRDLCDFMITFMTDDWCNMTYHDNRWHIYDFRRLLTDERLEMTLTDEMWEMTHDWHGWTITNDRWISTDRRWLIGDEIWQMGDDSWLIYIKTVDWLLMNDDW